VKAAVYRSWANAARDILHLAPLESCRVPIKTRQPYDKSCEFLLLRNINGFSLADNALLAAESIAC
jgi:hypothetical protein